ncbi:ATP-binding protein [Streptomyces sp. NPDC056290]|uniref:ATP-binding protein n=1 Tax=Streptomyces sp. NPDC056290 TaxID=3345771 RepID=UPI0035D81069
MSFTSTPRGARLARKLASHRLDTWGYPYESDTNTTVTLIVAELVSNAVTHGRVPGRDFALSLSHDEGRGVVRIEVTDTHPVLPTRRTPGTDEDGGRGLLLVDALATDWGVHDRLGPGKTVWAECTTTLGSDGPHA